MTTPETGGESTITPAAATISIESSVKPEAKPEKPAAPESITLPKSAFDARLEQARNSVLKELGIESIDAGKAVVAASKAADDAKKTDAQKAADAATALAAMATENKQLADTMGEVAKSVMAGLTDAQKAAVTALAGENPALQIKTVNALRPLWTTAPAAIGTEPAKAAVIANTAVTKAAPKDEGNSGGAPDPKALYEANKDKNPFFWARFAEQHGLFTPSA